MQLPSPLARTPMETVQTYAFTIMDKEKVQFMKR